MRPGCSTMLELQSTLFLWILFVCVLQLSIADTLDRRKALPEPGFRIPADLNRHLTEIPSHLFWRDDQLTKDAGPLGQHPQVQLIDKGGPLHTGKLNDLGQNPRQIDLGPHRPNGQVPSSDGIRLTQLEMLSGRKLGQRLNNTRDIDIGSQRPGGQSSPDDSVSMGKLLYPGRQNDLGGITQRKSGFVFSQGEGRRHRDGDIGPQRPNGQFPLSVDLGPQRPNGQHPPKGIDKYLFGPSNRFRRDVDRQNLGWQVHQNDEPLFLLSSELFVDDSSDNDIEVSPYAKILTSEDDSNRINSENTQDLGLHKPVGSVDLNGVPSSPVDLGPQRLTGQHPPSIEDLGPHRPSGQHPLSTEDLGPHRPSGQHPPSTEDLGPHRPSVQHLPSTEELGPHRPSGQYPPSTADLGPQRPSGQHPPSATLSQPVDLGPHRPNGAKDSNGIPPPPSDLGPHRPSGQHPPSASTSQRLVIKSFTSYLGSRRPSRATDFDGLPPPSDLEPHRPSGQHPPFESESKSSSPFQTTPSDLGPHRTAGATDPNGVTSPSDFGPQRPSGQHPPSDSASHTMALHFPPSDLGPHRPSGNKDPNGLLLPPIDLGPQIPSGQHPSGSTQKMVLADPVEDASQTMVVYRSPPSDLGPHRPSGATDPNGIPLPPIDLRPQRPSGQHPSSIEDLGPHRPSGQHSPSTEDLGPHRPSGQYPPGSEQRIILTDPLEDASQKVVVYRSPPSDLGPHRPSGATDPNGIPSPPVDLGPQRLSGQHPPSAVDLGPQRPFGQHPPEPVERIVLTDPLEDGSEKIVVFRSSPSDLGLHIPSGATEPNGLLSPPIDLGPQRPSGQHPPSTDDLGSHRPSGQHPPGSGEQRIILIDPLEDASQKVVVYRSPPRDLGPHRPSGNTDPNGIPSPPIDLGPQRPSGQHPPLVEDIGPHRPSGQHPPGSLEKIASVDPVQDASQKVALLYSPPSDLGPYGPSGATDPNGIATSPTDLGPQRPSGQHPPTAEDLGSHRPSGQLPPENAQRVILADPTKDVSQLYSPPSDLGPHRPSGATDPNGLPTPPGDLGPHRPSGQHPPRPDDPLRIESIVQVPPIDLGPHRPVGPTDPNIKPGIENDQDQSYNIYWNVPTFMCHKHGYRFRNLSSEYGIVQNPNDAFRGPRIAILYDPGLFPAILQDEKGKKFLRNGGVPQEGDIQKHLAALEDSIEEQVPKDFDGLGVIDFEAWRPVWPQNWGILNIYRTVSVDLEKRRDPTATRRALEIRAKVRFEAAARVFFEASIQLAQQLRPRGRWGFYGFPHCFNQVPARPTTRPADYTCAPQHQHQNDKIDWLWRASTALYPSVYLTKANKTAEDELAFVSGRLAEAQRVAKGVPVYAYVWYRYHDTRAFLNEDDLWSSLSVPHRLNLAGTILWGSSSDLNNRDKCARFSQALQTSIGPAVARAIGRRVEKTSPSPTVIFSIRR